MGNGARSLRCSSRNALLTIVMQPFEPLSVPHLKAIVPMVDDSPRVHQPAAPILRPSFRPRTAPPILMWLHPLHHQQRQRLRLVTFRESQTYCFLEVREPSVPLTDRQTVTHPPVHRRLHLHQHLCYLHFRGLYSPL